MLTSMNPGLLHNSRIDRLHMHANVCETRANQTLLSLSGTGGPNFLNPSSLRHDEATVGGEGSFPFPQDTCYLNAFFQDEGFGS